MQGDEQHPADACLAMLHDRQKNVKRSVVRTGFDDLDKATGGLQPGTLTIIAGRSSHGKSTLSLDIFYRVSPKNPKHMSLEGNAEEPFLFLCKSTGISPLRIKPSATDDQIPLTATEIFNAKNAIGFLRDSTLISTTTAADLTIFC